MTSYVNKLIRCLKTKTKHLTFELCSTLPKQKRSRNTAEIRRDFHDAIHVYCWFLPRSTLLRYHMKWKRKIWNWGDVIDRSTQRPRLAIIQSNFLRIETKQHGWKRSQEVKSIVLSQLFQELSIYCNLTINSNNNRFNV